MTWQCEATSRGSARDDSSYERLPCASSEARFRGRVCRRERKSRRVFASSINGVQVTEHTKEFLAIDLSNLVPSPFNVRRHAVGQVEELAALIDAQGLLHNLVVTEQVVGRGKGRKVKFAVAAGERRRRALLLLQQRGRLPKAHEVLCELVPPERALEVSLAENSGREAIRPMRSRPSRR